MVSGNGSKHGKWNKLLNAIFFIFILVYKATTMCHIYTYVNLISVLWRIHKISYELPTCQHVVCTLTFPAFRHAAASNRMSVKTQKCYKTLVSMVISCRFIAPARFSFNFFFK